MNKWVKLWRHVAGKPRLDGHGWSTAGIEVRCRVLYARRQGAKWNAKERSDLETGWRRGKTLNTLAAIHERSIPSVTTQLARMGLLDPYVVRQWCDAVRAARKQSA